jgi:hypothetical protein
MLSFIPTPTKDPTLVSQIAKESIFQITGKLPKKDEN